MSVKVHENHPKITNVIPYPNYNIISPPLYTLNFSGSLYIRLSIPPFPFSPPTKELVLSSVASSAERILYACFSDSALVKAFRRYSLFPSSVPGHDVYLAISVSASQ